MGVEIRKITDDEWPAFARACALGFNDPEVKDDDVEDWRKNAEIERTFAAFDKGKIVGTCGIYTFELTVPGNAMVPQGGVTEVTVRATHRRQGVLSNMMRLMFDDCREKGEPLAGLYASESIIYPRFGYGRATESAAFLLDNRYGTFREPAEATGIDLIDGEAAAKVFPEVFDKHRARQPGEVTRRPGWWDQFFKDKEKNRGGASARFYAIHETKGKADGYASWRVKGSWEHGAPNGTVQTAEVVGLNPEAEISLWRFILDLDLTRRVEGWNFQVSHPLRPLLADSRRLRVTDLTDQTWCRLLDIPAALSARRYGNEGSIVLDIVDPFVPENTGRYALDGGPDGATCKATKKKADVKIEVSDLGSLYLGGFRLGPLVQARRAEASESSIKAFDSMFLDSTAPFCHTDY